MECSSVLTPIGYLRVHPDGSVEFSDTPCGLTGPDTVAAGIWEQYLQGLSLPKPEVDRTTFSGRVLDALRGIPFGQTVTYGRLAELAGNPRAVRAAANVVARNRHALIFPCHRVVPASGGYGKYRWGSDRKQWLINYEETHSNLQK